MWTLIVVAISASALIHEVGPGHSIFVEPTAFVPVNAIAGFESEDACENSQSVKFGKQYIDVGWTYMCLPTKLGIDPDILAHPDATGRIIYLRKQWSK